MPELRLQRTRPTLPDGYQFCERILSFGDRQRLITRWLEAADNADACESFNPSGGFMIQAQVWRACAEQLQHA